MHRTVMAWFYVRLATPWSALLICAIIALPPLAIRLGHRESTHTMEQLVLVSSMETWQAAASGDSNAWLMPTNNGLPRVNKPPLLVWWNMLAWNDLGDDPYQPELMIFRTRIVSVLAGLLIVTGVFWCGVSLADVRYAALAALVAASAFFFQKQARTASYDIHVAAWSVLCIAGVFWATLPSTLHRSQRSRLLGWLIAYLALAAALFSKGPIAFIFTLPAIALAIAHSPHRVKRTLQSLSMIAVVSACLSPWWILAYWSEEAAMRIWWREVAPPNRNYQSSLYYLGLVALVFPWSIFLVAGLIDAWKMLRSRLRAVFMIPCLWLVLIIIILTIPAIKQQRYIIPAIAPASLLIAALLRYSRFVFTTRRKRIHFSKLGILHWIVLLMGSVGLCVALSFDDTWRRVSTINKWLDPLMHGSLSLVISVAIGLVLCAISILGLTLHRRQHVTASGILTSIWSCVFFTTLWYVYSSSPNYVQAVRAEAMRLAEIVGDAPVYMIRDGKEDRWLHEEFRFYLGKTIAPKRPSELEEFTGDVDSPFYVFWRFEDDDEGILRPRGFEYITQAESGRGQVRHLWRFDP